MNENEEMEYRMLFALRDVVCEIIGIFRTSFGTVPESLVELCAMMDERLLEMMEA